jgi:hypothetical protein
VNTSYSRYGYMKEMREVLTRFIQEIRVSIPIGQKVEWLLGGFDTHENSTHN